MSDAYNPATRPCAHGPMPGCTSLQHTILGYWSPHATNVGTFICRPVTGGDGPSVHGNGRAGDIGPSLPLIQDIADWLVANHTVLGVQLVICDHRIWSVARQAEGWRAYGCDKPGSKLDHHTTHVHWEINDDAGARLTPRIIDSVRPHQPQPAPTPIPALEDDMPLIIRPVPDNTPGQDPNVGGEFLLVGSTLIAIGSQDELQQLKNSGITDVRDMETEAWARLKHGCTVIE